MLDESDHFHSAPRNIVRFNVGNVPISLLSGAAEIRFTGLWGFGRGDYPIFDEAVLFGLLGVLNRVACDVNR